MEKVLYMHTGSGNHGCEALVRTTARLLNGPSDVSLWSFAKQEDMIYGSAGSVQKIYESEELSRCSVRYLEAVFRRKILQQQDANKKVFLKEIFKNKIAVSIGGDNYCYPWSAKQAVELDREIRKYCKLNVLWGCSIDPEAMTVDVIKDLSGFDLITAREGITYKNLKRINPHTVQVADPAFLLDPEYLPLPENFKERNTVGINVSPLIMKYGIQENIVLENYENLISFILRETDMNVCFIPHVVWNFNDDRVLCRFLYNKFRHSSRTSMIEDGNCQQLKGYISRCRFLVAARTHASIAAYSTHVPTLVVGYSVKSRGIAQDIFGTDEKYVLPVQNLTRSSDLTENFQWMMKKEQEQIRTLKRIMPEYKENAIKATRELDSMIT